MQRSKASSARHSAWPFLASLVAWEIAAAVYMLVRFTAAPEAEFIDWAQGPGGVVLMSLVGGFVLAVFDWLANAFLFRSRLRTRSFGLIIAFKVFALVLGALLVILISRVVAAAIGESPWGDVIWDFLIRVTDKKMAVALLYVGVTAAVMALLKQLTAIVGGRVLANLVTGKYFIPKAEDRIFMFLDLRASTHHAGELGNDKFCRLVQDCFRDLTDSAIRHRVEIYKYVGDEAILTWTIEDGASRNNCLGVFFDFRDALERRRSYYESTYGMFPEFKAGANVGTVTALEIGVVKREIAYLSEVLNTAARIEGKCNEFGQDFLISGELLRCLEAEGDPSPYAFDKLGAITLRGKATEVELYGVARPAADQN